jgi:hypothetical protein
MFALWRLRQHLTDLESVVYEDALQSPAASRPNGSERHRDLVKRQGVQREAGKVLYELTALLNVYGVTLESILADYQRDRPDPAETVLPRRKRGKKEEDGSLPADGEQIELL